MKLSLSIKLLTILLILHRISCAVPDGMVLVKNLTGLTAMGVFNLGKHINGGSITVQSLIDKAFLLDFYQKIMNAKGDYTGRKSKSLIIQPKQTLTVTLDHSS